MRPTSYSDNPRRRERSNRLLSRPHLWSKRGNGNKRRWWLTTSIMASIIMAIAASGCSSGSGTPSASSAGPTGTLNYYFTVNPWAIDPYLVYPGIAGSLWDEPIYDTLTQLNSNFTVSPLLATSWQVSASGPHPYVDLTLRQGLKFPDGAPFNADTVVASIHRSQSLKGSDTAADVMGDTVKKLSNYEVRIYAANAVALPRILGGPVGMMISQKAIADHTNLTLHSEGIGMYNLNSFGTQGVYYTANPNYWDKASVKAEHLVILSNSDDNTRLNLMKTGATDITTLSPALDPSAKGLGYKAVGGPFTATYGFAVDTAIKPLNNPLVREALALAINRPSLCKVILFSECKANNQLFPYNVPGWDASANATELQYDPAKARQLIQKAGAEGAQFTVVNMQGEAKFASMTAAVQAEWDAIGLHVTVITEPVASEETDFGVKHTAAVALFAFDAFADPSQGVSTYLAADSLYNPGHYNDPVIDSLAAQGLATANQAARTAIYQKISLRTIQDLVDIPIMTPNMTYWVKDGVTGFKLPLDNSDLNFRGVSVGS
jgi:peptide/nickel transport system substrate-binding protein